MNKIENYRNMIDGELNRIAVTDNVDEIKSLCYYLLTNMEGYIQENIGRINFEKYIKKASD